MIYILNNFRNIWQNIQTPNTHPLRVVSTPSTTLPIKKKKKKKVRCQIRSLRKLHLRERSIKLAWLIDTSVRSRVSINHRVLLSARACIAFKRSQRSTIIQVIRWQVITLKSIVDVRRDESL